jgi:hypothetical protein
MFVHEPLVHVPAVFGPAEQAWPPPTQTRADVVMVPDGTQQPPPLHSLPAQQG